MDKTLTLTLKKQWFDMIKSGEKKEEYRELKYHWLTRLFRVKDIQKFYGVSDVTPLANGIAQETFAKDYDRIVFTLGYPKADDTERRLMFKNPRIRIGTGRPEWGADPGKMYFVITWEAKMATATRKKYGVYRYTAETGWVLKAQGNDPVAVGDYAARMDEWFEDGSVWRMFERAIVEDENGNFKANTPKGKKNDTGRT